VAGTIEGRKVALGDAAMMQADGIDVAGLKAAANEMRNAGATAIFAAVDAKAIGVIAVADPVKPTTAAAVSALRDAGVRVVMLTGDNRKTAEAVARELGIQEIEAEILPQDKGKVVEQLRKQGGVVAMAGDGVNDAPALAAADIGVAMGTGTDVAIESAGVTPCVVTSTDCQGAPAVASDYAQHPPEPVLRFRLQCRRRAHCRRRALSRDRAVAVPGHSGSGDGALVG
jgi:Cu+-exporting ATPase